MPTSSAKRWTAKPASSGGAPEADRRRLHDTVVARAVLGRSTRRLRDSAVRHAELARLAERGLTPETDPVVVLDGPHVELCFQRVALEQRRKNPVHLDITSTAWRAEIERLVALGATVKEEFDAHAWMLDPEGNDFCVVDAGAH
jgi:hypothetical protein